MNSWTKGAGITEVYTDFKVDVGQHIYNLSV